MVGLEGNRLPEACGRFVELAQVVQRVAQVIVRRGEVWPESQSTEEAFDGLAELPLISQRVAQVVARVDVIGFEPEGLLVAGGGLGEVAQMVLGVPQAVPGIPLDPAVAGFRAQGECLAAERAGRAGLRRPAGAAGA